LSNEQRIDKATNIPTNANLTPNDKRMPLGFTSLPSLSTLQGYIFEEARRELQFPNSINLFKQMSLDPNIASATSLIEMMVGKVEWKVEVPENSNEEEKRRRDKINYNLEVMDRPWQDYITEFLSYITYGFHLSEKVYGKVDTPDGEYVGIKDLPTISQDTVDKWIFNTETGKLEGVRQDLNRIITDLKMYNKNTSYKDISKKKFMLFRHSVKRDNPEGNSPLKSCYVSWKHRNIIEEYETIGVTKDMGGTPVIGIDVAYLSKASQDSTSHEAIVVEELKRQAASLHAGDQTYVVKPIAYDEKGKELFSFDLKGIDGGILIISYPC
jgi:hypothetical protein